LSFKCIFDSQKLPNQLTEQTTEREREREREREKLLNTHIALASMQHDNVLVFMCSYQVLLTSELFLADDMYAAILIPVSDTESMQMR
jgi:hypothetical protein